MSLYDCQSISSTVEFCAWRGLSNPSQVASKAMKHHPASDKNRWKCVEIEIGDDFVKAYYISPFHKVLSKV